MYLARFSYDVLPANRQRAIDFIRGEVEAAHRNGLSARMLVPLTRGQGAAALQFEVELGNLDQLDQVRHRGGEADEDSGSWMHAFSEILVSPPGVEILRVDEMPVSSWVRSRMSFCAFSGSFRSTRCVSSTNLPRCSFFHRCTRALGCRRWRRWRQGFRW